MAQVGLNTGSFHSFVHPKWPTIIFDPFLTHFWSQAGPFSRHFKILHGPKCVTTGSIHAKNT